MKSVGFIGTGRMGSALVKAMKGLKRVGTITAFDVDSGRLESLGVESASGAAAVAVKSDVIFICVKPKDVGSVLDSLGDSAAGKLVVSIAAGVKTETIEGKLSGARVVRMMPNTPAVVGEMAAGYCLGETTREGDERLVEDLLSPGGVVVKVSEDLMDAVTGLSGSGPAYVYYIIDALAKAGVEEGLGREDALKLAAQTVKGAGEMILAGEGSAEELIDAVCSPGGTTIEGMKVLRESDITGVLAETVKAAIEKSKKLSK